MIRLLHVVAITLLLVSAGYAYQTKYETLFYAESLAKLKRKVQKEREAIAVAKAEWALLTRPDRLQPMVDRHLDLQPMTIAQLTRLADIPNKPARGDLIAMKLDTLGLDPVATGSVNPAPKPLRAPGLPATVVAKPAGAPAARPGGIAAIIQGLAEPGPKDKRPAAPRPATASGTR